MKIGGFRPGRFSRSGQSRLSYEDELFSLSMRIYTLLLSTVLIVSSVTDLIRKANIGPLTMQGVWTIIVALACASLILLRHRLPKSSFWALGMVIFVFCGILSSYINLPTSPIGVKEQSQNLLVYAAFTGLIFLSAGESYREPFQPPWYITHGFMRASQITIALYALSLPFAGFGNSIFQSARSFAIFAIVAMAWLLASWKHKVWPRSGLYALALTALVAFSFSRTATVICLILVPLSQLSPTNGKSWFRVGIWVGLITLVAYLSFTYVEPIRDRFTDKGDSGKIGSVQVNTSGRERMWEAAGNSAMEAPIFGKGPGSVGYAIAAVNSSAAGHPHNDYLRLRHDFGWVGLFFWLGSYVLVMLKSLQNWAWAERRDPVSVHVHQASVLAQIAVLIMMATDNIVVYQFAMAPLGILMGASLGLGQARRKLTKEVQVMDWMDELPTEFTLQPSNPEQTA
jgi:O-antigen ligase